MPNELETEKRKAAEAEANAESFRVMLEESRAAYAIVYQACEHVVAVATQNGEDHTPEWYKKIADVVCFAMAIAELKSPFNTSGLRSAEIVSKNGMWHGYCRVCGAGIGGNGTPQYYCGKCSRSTGPTSGTIVI